MIDQLSLAKNYLKLETERVSSDLWAADGRLSPLKAKEGGWAAAAAAGEGADGGEVDYAKASIWTVAYGGTPRQLQAHLDRVKEAGVLHGVGYVNLHHRQWGIKKAGEAYQLGLGMKATPLQFAAVAQRLDNVMVLLSNGARDQTEPRLRALCSPETYELILKATKPQRAVGRPPSSAANGAAVVVGEAAEEEEGRARPCSADAVAAENPVIIENPDAVLKLVPDTSRCFTSVSVQPVAFTC